MGNNPKVPIGRGRPPGAVNKATANAREAIAAFVEGNVERLNGWLDAIALGERETAQDKDGNDYERWLREPNPDAAFKAYMSVIEYHIPKLNRSEVSGPNGGPIKTETSLPSEDKDIINRFLLQKQKEPQK